MKCRHTLIYTSLFLSPMAFADSTALEAVSVVEHQMQEHNEGSYQSRVSNIANKGATPLMDSPQTVNVVNQQLIQDRQPKSIDEALSTVSGTTQANTLGGLMDAVLKRGFGKNRDNSILRNGVIAGPSHNFSATTARVEVLKGPASVLYGIQDPGGVINLVTKKPEQDAKYTLGASVGSNQAWGTSFDATGGLGNGFAYRFIYDQTEKAYWRNFGEIKRALYAPSLRWQNAKSDITLSYEHQDYVDPFDRGTYLLARDNHKGQFVSSPKRVRLDEKFNEATGKIDIFSLQAHHQLNDFWRLNATYAYTKDSYRYWQARVTRINPEKDQVTQQIEGIQGSMQQNHSGSVNAVGEFATGDIAHRVVMGVDLARTSLDIRRYQAEKNSTIRLSRPTYHNVSTAGMPLAANNGHQFARLNTLGAYLQDSAYLTDKLILSGGIRYEYYDQEAGRGGRKAANRFYTDDHGAKWLYQGGVVYKFTPNWAIYGNYAQSFRPQLSRAAVTEGLKPEQGNAYEIGTKYENGYFSTNFALFNIDKKNVSDTYTGKDGLNYAYLVGKQRSQGVEWDLNGRLTERLGLTATYAYTHTKTLANSKFPYFVGKAFEGVPKHQASLFATYDLGNVGFGNLRLGNLRLGAGARYLGSWKVYNTFNPQFEAYKLPHAIVTDAFIALETKVAGKELSLQLNGKNLGNKTYYTSTLGTTNSVIPVAYGAAREIVLSGKIAF